MMILISSTEKYKNLIADCIQHKKKKWNKSWGNRALFTNQEKNANFLVNWGPILGCRTKKMYINS